MGEGLHAAESDRDDEGYRSPNGPVALGSELDDLVARVRRQEPLLDPAEVWLRVARYALARAGR